MHGQAKPSVPAARPEQKEKKKRKTNAVAVYVRSFVVERKVIETSGLAAEIFKCVVFISRRSKDTKTDRK